MNIDFAIGAFLTIIVMWIIGPKRLDKLYNWLFGRFLNKWNKKINQKQKDL